jgi:hypothetical protein
MFQTFYAILWLVLPCLLLPCWCCALPCWCCFALLVLLCCYCLAVAAAS